MTRARLACAAVLAGCLAAWAAEGEKKEEGLPIDLARVPTKALGLVSVRVADLYAGELGRGLRAGAPKDMKQALAEAEKAFGMTPGDIERVTFVLKDPRSEPMVFVLAKKPLAANKLFAALVPGGKQEQYGGQALFANTRNQAACLLGERAFVLGTRGDVQTLIGTKTQPAGGLTAALHLAAQKHSAVLGLNVAAFPPLPEELPPDAEAFKPLLAATGATLTLDLGAKATAHLRVVFPTAEAAAAGVKALTAGKKLGLGAIAGFQAELKKAPEAAGVRGLVGLLGQGEKSLQAVAIRRDGAVVTARLEAPIDAKVLAEELVVAAGKAREAARRLQSVNNLKQLALAMHNYHDKNGTFPPQAVYSKDGKPLLSWRVLVLPYLEQQNLYREFKLDEPWDGAHNKKLLAKMPKVFLLPGPKPKHPYGTFYQGFVGKSAFFEGKKGLQITDFTDGTSNTIMVVEAAKDVPWTKPEDVPFGPGKLLPLLGKHFRGLFNAALCDGAVRGISTAIKEPTLRAAVTRDGGETLGADW